MSARFEARKGPNGWWDVIDRSKSGEDRIALCYRGDGAKADAEEAAELLNQEGNV